MKHTCTLPAHFIFINGWLLATRWIRPGPFCFARVTRVRTNAHHPQIRALLLASVFGVELFAAILGMTRKTIELVVSEKAWPIKLFVARVSPTLLARIIPHAVRRRRDGRVQQE